MSYNLPWPLERVELLKKLTEEGLSCSEIGVQLHVSRNAVIGKQHRIHMHSQRPRGGNTEAHKRKRKRAYKRAEWAVPGLLANGKQQHPLLLTDLPPEPPIANPIGIFEIKDGECRWPVSGEGHEILFCGAAVLGTYSYCSHHCCRAFTTRPSMSRAEYEIHMRKLAKNNPVRAVSL